MVGEVDHGKSSIVGRLLQETGAISPSRIETVKAICKDQGKDFEPAFLLDAFEEEQRQGITIDVSHVQIKTKNRLIKIIDAPGHREFLKNMVSGSSYADAAIVLVDAKLGIQEQSKRHCYLLKLLGIQNVIVLVNKMDLADYEPAYFEKIKLELSNYLEEVKIGSAVFIPVSAKTGENLLALSANMPWYNGSPLIEAVEKLPLKASSASAALRFAVQDVYKFDDRRIIAGRVESGTVKIGDRIKISPGQNEATITDIVRWKCDKPNFAEAGESIGLTFDSQVFVERGQTLILASDQGQAYTRVNASIFWMGQRPLRMHDHVIVKLLTQEVVAEVSDIHHVIDTSNLTNSKTADLKIDRFMAAEIGLQFSHPIFADEFNSFANSGRIVLVDSQVVSGGGIITKLIDLEKDNRAPKSQNISREVSTISNSERIHKNRHKGAIIWMTGLSGSGKSTIAKIIERRLFDLGAQTFILDGDNIRHGLSRDLDFSLSGRSENLRRVAEVAKLIAQSGQIVIAAFITPFEQDRAQIRKIMDGENFYEVFVDCPLVVCEGRDPKGLYKKARAGELVNFTGISSPFETPKSSALVINSSHFNAIDNAAKVVRLLKDKKIIDL